jgi:hypothetical protein
MVALAAGAVAAAAAMSTSPARSALTSVYSSVDGWLNGAPGTEASVADKDLFAVDHREWTGFPLNVHLRKLAEATVGDSTFKVLGFRSGDTLCIRVVANGKAQGAMLSCVPVVQLKNRPQPAAVVAVDYPFQNVGSGSSNSSAAELVTVGIVADGISDVEMQRADGTHSSALVANNTFIAVASHSASARTTRVSAMGTTHERFELPLALAPAGMAQLPNGNTTTAAPGPTHVDRRITGGSIGWLDRGDAVGAVAPDSKAFVAGTVLFRRMLIPDPQSVIRVVVSLMGGTPSINRFFPGQKEICVTLLAQGAGGSGCWTPDQLFARGPVTIGEAVISGSDQQTLVYGVASDDVARLQIYLADGQVLPVAIRDNAYGAALLRTTFPARVVAYDNRNRVIGIQLMHTDGISQP